MGRVGGEDDIVVALCSCERLDVATNAWMRGPDMLSERTYLGVCVLNEEVWAIGGSRAQHDGPLLHGELWIIYCFSTWTERLDAVTNQWVRGPDQLEVRSNFGLAVFQGQLWAVGGCDNEIDHLSSCEYLDAASDTWMAGPPMNSSRSGHGLAVLDGELWAVGGYGQVGGLADEEGPLQSCERLDATTNTWIRPPHANCPPLLRGEVLTALN